MYSASTLIIGSLETRVVQRPKLPLLDQARAHVDAKYAGSCVPGGSYQETPGHGQGRSTPMIGQVQPSLVLSST